ncbi:MAG: methylenetetrahydrofolate--tRNA-(uracil(54)-C(5))-methyltransferase (FADH(2)-oxidizing) TrmFO [Clostridia bacterium]|nr:methylenetetrahydrofolate--tRNA-(uracil(54)-C(5))-methyltransferase (FADH(2)-oxidizing) TrmFO [Clostridia bacterium]
MKEKTINVIGAGLAGCEAALAAVRTGVGVKLYEMKPERYTPAHKSPGFAELVCSNSLRSDSVTNAVGLLKEEMRALGSAVMKAADSSRVPAGSALAVDRERFSSDITRMIKSCPDIEVITGEVTSVPESGVSVIATGPLTSDGLASSIERDLGCTGLHFYDAAAPIVDGSTVDTNKAFYASRYGKGDADYLNCPMTEEEYAAFYRELVSARRAELHSFDGGGDYSSSVFEGCMPVEVMAMRGPDTLRFGPLKPVGLEDPRYPGRQFYAVVQLRKENLGGSMFNLVGFQTNLAFPEQRRVFRMIPGLENAEFLRYGVMHRNTYLDSPGFLSPDYSVISRPGLYFAGQITGVEGYVESAGSGLVAGICAARQCLGLPKLLFPEETMLGSMAAYVSRGSVGRFQPMNANFGIIAPLEQRVRGGKQAKFAAYAERSLAAVRQLAARLFPDE